LIKSDLRSTTPKRPIGLKNTPTPLNKPNYIADLRKQNLELEKNGVKLKKDCQNWERYLKDNNLNNNQKFDSVLNRAQIMENQAKMKEKVASVAGADPETENEINNLYTESIKAKLALLENMKN
jgi:ABC-type lipoprotein release transport system permease subunit